MSCFSDHVFNFSPTYICAYVGSTEYVMYVMYVPTSVVLHFIVFFIYTAILCGLHVEDFVCSYPHCKEYSTVRTLTRKEYSLAFRPHFDRLEWLQGFLFDTAFSPFTTCGQAFRQRNLYVRYYFHLLIYFIGQDHRPISNT